MTRLSVIPPDVCGLLLNGQGVFTTRDAAAVGVSDDRVQRLVRADLLAPVAKGVYASTEQLSGNPWVAHALRARGFVRACGPLTLATGWSAVAVRDLPTIGRPPPLPTVVRAYPSRRGSSRTRFGVIRVTAVPAEHYSSHAGCPTVSPAWMVANLARTASRPAVLVVADAVLRAGTSREDLSEVIAQLRGWPGVLAADWVVDHADPRSESVLETLGRLSCIEGGLPVPLSNVWVGPGYPLFRVDHLWPDHWLVAEGDGALKYRGDDISAVVWAEKERHWTLRRMGLDVVRYDWHLAARARDELAARIRSVLRANPVRTTPVQWWADRCSDVGLPRLFAG